MKENPLLNVKEAIAMYKHLLAPSPSFGTDVYKKDFTSEGIVLIEDKSTKSQGKAMRFDCYALILRLKGKSKRSVSMYDYIIEPRSLQLINPGSLFAFEDISQSAKSFVLLFDKDFIVENNLSSDLIKKLISFHKTHEENIQLDLNIYAQVLYIYEQINAEFRVKDNGYIELIKTYVNQLLYILKREKEKLQNKNKYTKSEQLCSTFLSLVEENFKSKKKVYEYADILGITSNYLSEISQEYLHTNALNLIHRRILKESEYLLIHTEITIHQIAFKLNFNSSSQFGRFFKRNYGISPKEFRQKNY